MRIPISPTLFLSLVCLIGACTLYEGTPSDTLEPNDGIDAGYWPPGLPQDGGPGWTEDAGPGWIEDAGFGWSEDDAGLDWIEDAGPGWIEDAGLDNGCEFIFQEAICVVTAGCQPQYNGVNCSCDMVSCHCDAFEFESCQ